MVVSTLRFRGRPVRGYIISVPVDDCASRVQFSDGRKKRISLILYCCLKETCVGAVSSGDSDNSVAAALLVITIRTAVLNRHLI